MGASGSVLPGSKAASSAPRACIANAASQDAARMWCCRLCFASTWTTASLMRCAICTGKFANHAAAAAMASPAAANDVKLSPGGIREIEFTVQLLQVVRGGQFPSCAAAPPCRPWSGWPKPASCPRHGPATGPGLPLFAPGGAPHPVPGRPANPCPAHRAMAISIWIARTMGLRYDRRFFRPAGHPLARAGCPGVRCPAGRPEPTRCAWRPVPAPRKRPGPGPQNPPELQALLADARRPWPRA